MAEETKEVLKGRTIRTSDDTYERFRKIAQENFDSQGQCFSSLIHLFELEQGKKVLGQRKLEIENFQMHINTLLQMFINSLQMNEDAEERVKSGIQDMIDTKDRIILQLQKERQELKQDLDENSQAKKELESSFNEAKTRYEKETRSQRITIEQLTQTIEDRQDMIELLTNQKKELQSQVEYRYELEQKLKQLESELFEQQQTVTALENEKILSKQLHEQEIAKLEREHALDLEKSEFELKKALLEQEKSLQSTWETERMKEQKRSEEYEMKYLAALEKIEQLTHKNKEE